MRLTVNGRTHTLALESRTSLLDALYSGAGRIRHVGSGGAHESGATNADPCRPSSLPHDPAVDGNTDGSFLAHVR